MRSWIFRHRARLKVIYGLSPLPEEAEGPRDSPARPVSEAEKGVALEPSRRGGRCSLAPGTLARRASYVVLAPMRPPAL